MAINLFGFTIKRKDEDKPLLPSVVPPGRDDGSIIVGAGGGHYAYTYDVEGQAQNELDLIRRYRSITNVPEVDEAITQIVDEALVFDTDNKIIELNLEELKVGEPIKKKFQDAFDEVLNLLEFETKGADYFRSWYVDGRLPFHILMDLENQKEGIQELRYIDPRKIRKVKEIKKSRNARGVEIIEKTEEYYLFNDKGIGQSGVQGIKLSLDSVAYCHSGIIDGETGMVLGFLHKAIRPANQLRMMEDALVIYRLSRAPERRIFYIDVGNLPKGKAEQYVNDMMNKFRNKLVYDATTGEIADAKRHLAIMEDFWMPRRGDGKGTQIDTLPGGQNLSQIEDIEYFQNKLLRSLNVPQARLRPETGFTIGRPQETSREEVAFNKYINRLRTKFNSLFLDLLRVQLIAKGVLTHEGWEEIRSKIKFDYQKDNHFSELKDAEIMNNRLQSLQAIDPFVGKYFSKAWVQTNILHMNEEEIKVIESEIKAEGPSEEELAQMQDQEQQQQNQPQQGNENESEPA